MNFYRMTIEGKGTTKTQHFSDLEHARICARILMRNHDADKVIIEMPGCSYVETFEIVAS